MVPFEKYRYNVMKDRLSAAILFMAIPLYLAFSVLDWLFAPDLWLDFLYIRLATAFLFAAIAGLLRYYGQLKGENLIILGHFVTFGLGVGIGYMSFATGGLASPYYAGLNWIALGSLAFWPSGRVSRTISIVTIYFPLLFMELIFSSHRFFEPVPLLSLVFMGGTIFLSVLSNVLSDKSLRQEYHLRGELEELVKNKDRIIEVKSAQSAKLKRLAKQFSPAVIEAIESQVISLNERSRKRVAVMFVDVVGSTARSSSLDHSDYQKALDMFFELAIKKLMEANITVANFMGDGLMAIANAPYPVADFEKLAFTTGLEIIKETAARKRQFQEYWRDEFQVRVGISSGFASVGFFPNTDFGVYTAIGETVNLASRLCSHTEGMSVGTLKSVIISAESALNTCTVKKSGTIAVFKGFSGHELEFFVAKPKADVEEASGVKSCPLCRSPLAEAADIGDCYVVKCTACNYSDILSKDGGDGSSTPQAA